MKKNILFVILILSSYNSWSCFNEYHTKLNGTLEDVTTENKLVINELDKPEIQKKLVKYDSLFKNTNDIKYLSDYALQWALLGEYQKALTIFLSIESSHPKLYATASNIGTIYELMGKNDSALIWINKSIGINPHSHDGSEWIHVRILEEKIKFGNTPQYKSDFSFLGLDAGKDIEPFFGKFSEDSLRVVKKHLWHQLNERMTFVKPNDIYVAHLLYDLGNVEAKVGYLENALEAYMLSKKYGVDDDLLNRKIKEFKERIKPAARMNIVREDNPNKSWYRTYLKNEGLFNLLGIVTVFFMIFIIVKKIQR